MTTIVTKNGSGAPLASDLVQGELAVDLTNKRLYTENASGTVIEIGTSPSTIDINAGTIDGTVIGGSSAAAGTFTTFTSTGIDDNATSTAITIDSSENVGIGTASPDETLVVDGGAKILGTNYLSFTNTSDQTYIRAPASNTLAFGTDSTERVRIDSSGNVGIGVSSPTEKLHISGNALVGGEVESVASGTTTGFKWGQNTATHYWKWAEFNNETASLQENSTSSAASRISVAAGGNVGIGTSTPESLLHIEGNQTEAKLTLGRSSSNTAGNVLGVLQFKNEDGSSDGPNVVANIQAVVPNGNGSGGYLKFGTHDGTEGGEGSSPVDRMTIDWLGNVGIGTTSPSSQLNVEGSSTTVSIDLNASDSTIQGRLYSDDSGQTLLYADRLGNAVSPALRFYTGTSERMRINSTGSLILTGGGGTVTDTHGTASRTNLQLDGSSETIVTFSQSGTTRGYLNATSNSFDLVAGTGSKLRLLSNGSGSTAVTLDTSGNLLVGTTSGSHKITCNGSGWFNYTVVDNGAVYNNFSGASGITFSSTGVRPTNNQGTAVDDTYDVGHPSYRWDDVYATNGTIQTSDANEKQDIEALSEAETRVAVAAKALLRKFRWKSAVEEKGDEARVHFGIIAQDLKAAFEAEGLDAGRYAMFIHSTWTDEETGEERSRMGVRYSELLAFIIAAI